MEYRYKPTTNGRAAMAACMDLEKPFRVTRVAFGSGKVDEETNLADVHELLDYVTDGAVAERSHKDDRFNITIQYANSEHKEIKTFMLSEFIVYIEDPVSEEETDFLYGTLGDYRQPIPAYNPAYPASVFNFPLTLILSDEINVAVSAPAGIVTHDELLWAINNLTTQVLRIDLTIPVDGWMEDDETGGVCAFRRDIPQDGVTEKMVPFVHLLPAYTDIARGCELNSTVKTMNGALRVYAGKIPESPIKAEATLLCDFTGDTGLSGVEWGYTFPTATATRLGCVKVGDGLNVDKDGILSVDVASDAEVNQMLDGVFSPDNK